MRLGLGLQGQRVSRFTPNKVPGLVARFRFDAGLSADAKLWTSSVGSARLTWSFGAVFAPSPRGLRLGGSGGGHYVMSGISLVNAGELWVASSVAEQPTTHGQGYLATFGPDLDFPSYVSGTVYDAWATTVRKDTIYTPGALMNPGVMFCRNSVSAAGDFRNYLNGTLKYQTAANTFSNSVVNSEWFTHSGAPDTFYFNGTIAEILIYNRVLSVAERAANTQYMQVQHRIGE